MTRAKAKVEQIQAADRLLMGLLRTPKTRNGLIAAATSLRSEGVEQLSRNFVFGWISEKVRDGTLSRSTVSVGGSKTTCIYQLATCFGATIEIKPSEYPSWLEPRGLPATSSRTIHTDEYIVSIHGAEMTRTRKELRDDETDS